ncbi:MAG: hypothetical protein Q9200_006189 [Gallowayella weberi]
MAATPTSGPRTEPKFLKALGYLSLDERPAEIDERIQMHADTLYHQMLDRERQVEAAKKSDLPIPEFPPLVADAPSSSPNNDPRAIPTPATTSLGHPISASASALLASAQPMSYEETTDMYLKRILAPDARAAQYKEWERKGLSAEERLVQAKGMVMEAETGLGIAHQVVEILQETKKGMEERRANGTAGLGDTVSGWLGR